VENVYDLSVRFCCDNKSPILNIDGPGPEFFRRARWCFARIGEAEKVTQKQAVSETGVLDDGVT